MQYSIEVQLLPEIHNNRDMYFWSIVGNDNSTKFNYGFGWADSEIQAFNDGLNYYNTQIRNYKFFEKTTKYVFTNI